MNNLNKHYYYLPQIAFTAMLMGIFFSNALIQVAAVLFFLVGIWLFINKTPAASEKWMVYLIILFFLSGIISTLFSENPSVSGPAFMRHIVLFSLVPLLLLREQVKNWFSTLAVKLFITAATVVAVLAIYYHFLGAGRTTGFYGGPFTLASLMVFSIPITTGYLLSTNRLVRIALALSVLLQIFALWWSFTRSAFLALILGFFLLAFLYLRQQRVGNHQRQVWQWLMIITVPLLIIVLIFSSRDSRINPWVSPEKATTTTSDLTSGRGEILRDARHLIQEDWQIANWQAMLFGHGLRSRKILFRSQFRSWESDYLEVFINQGTVGLLLLLGIYYFFLRRVYFILQSREAHPQLWFIKGVAISALAFWLMSFLTLQIQSISSGAIFVFLYSWMIARAPVEKN